MNLITASVGFVNGYLRSGHYELSLNSEELEVFEGLSEEQKKEYIEDHGEFLLDDFRVNDMGELYDIKIYHEGESQI